MGHLKLGSQRETPGTLGISAVLLNQVRIIWFVYFQTSFLFSPVDLNNLVVFKIIFGVVIVIFFFPPYIITVFFLEIRISIFSLRNSFKTQTYMIVFVFRASE